MAEESAEGGAAPQSVPTAGQHPQAMPPPPPAEQAQGCLEPPAQLGADDRWQQPSPADKRGPVCRVPGCAEPLTQLYNMRHRVCVSHYRADEFYMEAGGPLCRFCQQCAKPHTLDCFDPGRRSCRESLQRHNHRRRPLAHVPGLSSKRRSPGRDAAADGSGGTNSTTAWPAPALPAASNPPPASLSSLDPGVAALLHMPLPQMLAAQLPTSSQVAEPLQQAGQPQQPEGHSPKRPQLDGAAPGSAGMAAQAPAASQGQGSQSSGVPSSAAVAVMRLGSSGGTGALARPQPVVPQPLRPQAVRPAGQPPAALPAAQPAGQGASLAEALASLLAAAATPQQPAAAPQQPAARQAAAQPAVPEALEPLVRWQQQQQQQPAAPQALAPPPPPPPPPPQQQQVNQEDQAVVGALASSMAGAVNAELLQTAIALQQRVEQLEQQLASERAERAQRAQRAARFFEHVGTGRGVQLLRARVRLPGSAVAAHLPEDHSLLAALAEVLRRPGAAASDVSLQSAPAQSAGPPQPPPPQQAPPQQTQQQQVLPQRQLASQQVQQGPQEQQQQAQQLRPADILAELLRQFGQGRPAQAPPAARAALAMQVGAAQLASQPASQSASQVAAPAVAQVQLPQQAQQGEQAQQPTGSALPVANGGAAGATGTAGTAGLAAMAELLSQTGDVLPESAQALARLLLSMQAFDE